jgi:hypothetical protein
LFISRQVFSPSSMPIRRIRQAVLALMERDAELAAKTGQPIRADPQRARPVIATGGFRGLFEALKKGVPTASFFTASCTRLQQVDRLRLELAARSSLVRMIL